MRVGAAVFRAGTPEEWVQRHREKGFGAAVFPLDSRADGRLIDEYAQAAREAGLVIAEVGAWSNPLDPDEEKAQAALKWNIGQLRLAERVGARCCVNISGSLHPQLWMGAHPGNLSEETFDRVVALTRRIIDEVQPQRTGYALECMPWSFPDSVDSYVRLLEAVDRPAFGVHLDPCNLISSPRLLFGNARLVEDAVARLGRRMLSVHIKDLYLNPGAANVELTEVPLGEGACDLGSWLKCLSALPDVPLILEHLPDEATYDRAWAALRRLARQAGVELTGC